MKWDKIIQSIINKYNMKLNVKKNINKIKV